jgi:hypothetical protein
LPVLLSQITFPVLEEVQRGIKEGNHWYVLSMNMQAGRFEALDSMRGEGNMSLTAHANSLVSRIKQIWNIHYNTSKVQIQDWDLKIINVPLQGNMYVEWFLICFSSFFLFLLHMYVFTLTFFPLLVDF